MVFDLFLAQARAEEARLMNQLRAEVPAFRRLELLRRLITEHKTQTKPHASEDAFDPSI